MGAGGGGAAGCRWSGQGRSERGAAVGEEEWSGRGGLGRDGSPSEFPGGRSQGTSRQHVDVVSLLQGGCCREVGGDGGWRGGWMRGAAAGGGGSGERASHMTASVVRTGAAPPPPGSSSAMWSTAAPAAVTRSERRPIADQSRCQGMSPVRHITAMEGPVTPASARPGSYTGWQGTAQARVSRQGCPWRNAAAGIVASFLTPPSGRPR